MVDYWFCVWDWIRTLSRQLNLIYESLCLASTLMLILHKLKIICRVFCETSPARWLQDIFSFKPSIVRIARCSAIVLIAVRSSCLN